jgi:hypothetical protein
MFLFGKYLNYLISHCCYLREKFTTYNIRCVVFKRRTVFSTKTLKPFGEVTLENATYNCPCEKTGDGRYTPIVFSVCPWLLFIVMTYESLIENCQHRSLKGHLVCTDVVIIRGMYALIHLVFPAIISASITLAVS